MMTLPMLDEKKTLPPCFREWICSGRRTNGDPCNRVLMEVDINSPQHIRKRCERCRSVNTIRQ